MQKTIVIGIHGEYSTPVIFESLARDLASLGYSFVPVTLPGHDITSKKTKRFSLADLALHVEHVIKRKRAEFPRARIFVIGHSMGASVINALYKSKSPVQKELSGVIFLAPIVGMSLHDLVELAWRYKQIIFEVALGTPHKPSFECVQTLVLNTTPPFDARDIYSRMVLESGKALRKALLERDDVIINVPRVSIFGSNDQTIQPRYTNTSVIVDGDHLQMIHNASHTIEAFIKEHSPKS